MAMDKDLIRKRFSKASATYNREASAQKAIAGEMCALLEHIASRKDFSEVLEIGCGTGVYTGMIKSRFNPVKENATAPLIPAPINALKKSPK